MNVQDLIEKLQKFDPNMKVVTGGFDEAGFADIEVIEIVSIKERISEAARQALGSYEKSDKSGNAAILIDHY